jgi:hypothetical protein
VHSAGRSSSSLGFDDDSNPVSIPEQV